MSAFPTVSPSAPASPVTSAAPASSASSQAGASSGRPVQFLLRLEGLAAATVAVLFYARSGASWWLFAALWIAPDLSMLGYLISPCRGARIYNAFHTYTLPVTLALCGVALHTSAVLPYALIWISHIGVDRLMGYGLKYSDGFGHTHLGFRRPRV